MATHFSTLAWRIPETEELSGLPSMGSHRVRHDRSDLAAAVAEKNNTPMDRGITWDRGVTKGPKELDTTEQIPLTFFTLVFFKTVNIAYLR